MDRPPAARVDTPARCSPPTSKGPPRCRCDGRSRSTSRSKFAPRRTRSHARKAAPRRHRTPPRGPRCAPPPAPASWLQKSPRLPRRRPGRRCRPGLEAVHRAKNSFAAPADGVIDHCFVCGRARDDGFCVFPGPVAGTDLVASPWTPPTWAADEDGLVRPEFVWAALDCPGYFALHGADLELAFLARQQTEVLTPLRAGSSTLPSAGRSDASEGKVSPRPRSSIRRARSSPTPSSW
jgi:hypothetical protein